MPAWTRDAEGEIAWCNGPYARAADVPEAKAGDRKGQRNSSIRRCAAKAAAAIREAGA